MHHLAWIVFWILIADESSVGGKRPLGADADVSFDRDVRPILAEKCFACHGPDGKARKANLRLDLAAGAFAERRGGAAIVAGDVESSPLVHRITATDPGRRMPPAETGQQLRSAEVALLKRWIEEGAQYETHGETDDFSYNIVRDPVHVHDLQATILHCLGIDHERLTFKYQGRRHRLTDVHGRVVPQLLA